MTRWVWSCLFVGALLVAGVGIPAAAAQVTGTYVCVHQVTGQVRIVSGPDECYPSEAGRSLQGGLPYAVVDATGQTVGETIRLDGGTATVVLTVQNLKFPLEVTTDGFKPNEPVFFPASAGGCTGLPYVYTSPYPRFPPLMRPIVGLPSATLYIPDDTRDPILSGPIEGYAFYVPYGSTTPTCTLYSTLSGPFEPVKPLVDLKTLGFPVPFRLR